MQASELSLEPFEQIAEDLYTRGISISTNAIPHKVLRALEARLNELDHDSFDVAGIGRQTDHATNATIRRDKIHWLDNNNELELSYLEHMDNSSNLLIVDSLWAYLVTKATSPSTSTVTFIRNTLMRSKVKQIVFSPRFYI